MATCQNTTDLSQIFTRFEMIHEDPLVVKNYPFEHQRN